MALTDGLIAFYSQEDNAANKIVLDELGSYNGTMNANNTQDMTEAGLVGDCLAYNGTDDWFTIGNIKTNFTTDASLCMWLKPYAWPQGTNHGGFTSLYYTGMAQATAFWTDGKFYCGIFRNDRLPGIDVNAYCSAGNWFMLTVTQKPGVDGYKIYINTTEIYSGAGEPAVATLATTITFGRSSVSTYRWKGSLDQIGVWNKSLSPAEVAELYNDGNGWGFGYVANSALGQQFGVAIETASTLGHQFGVALETSNRLGHKFTVPIQTKLFPNISRITRRRMR